MTFINWYSTRKVTKCFNRRNIVKGIDYLGDGGAKKAMEYGEPIQR